MVVVEGGKCPTPCKREGELSGRGKGPGENMSRGNVHGKCPDTDALARILGLVVSAGVWEAAAHQRHAHDGALYTNVTYYILGLLLKADPSGTTA